VIKYLGKADGWFSAHKEAIHKSSVKKLEKTERTYDLVSMEADRLTVIVEDEIYKLSPLETKVDRLRGEAQWAQKNIDYYEKQLADIEEGVKLRDMARRSIKPPILTDRQSKLIDRVEWMDIQSAKEGYYSRIENNQEKVDLYLDERKALYRERAKLKRKQKKLDKVLSSQKRLEGQIDEIQSYIDATEES
jgi:peptidoglycan hydrolase CwlO-like protein